MAISKFKATCLAYQGGEYWTVYGHPPLGESLEEIVMDLRGVLPKDEAIARALEIRRDELQEGEEPTGATERWVEISEDEND